MRGVVVIAVDSHELVDVLRENPPGHEDVFPGALAILVEESELLEHLVRFLRAFLGARCVDDDRYRYSRRLLAVVLDPYRVAEVHEACHSNRFAFGHVLHRLPNEHRHVVPQAAPSP